ncbi:MULTISPECIES: hypothetical protein [unclassified Microbacterium]|jgi:hypothetical protein|uniref:hypothetical protein n=1 Tax=unclassified Microbacterium TaxID=2609290 RepID=UPI0008DA3875|nr:MULTISPECIES: hypothetical protein [unclassified Microbacterium]MAY51442.1 hypothetical protein [Microbacterium sp.]HAS32306.1 hypothetical protein [Microbacterium sp.]HBR88848.1 hypothetical protein [Microbacterium sp.]HBS73693.1 hypothetical protein [Microbacterium sp.]|tara:strand:- start:63135 stop:63344 length:210 start_codon:yes stop_codon:yes gene_type:complete
MTTLVEVSHASAPTAVDRVLLSFSRRLAALVAARIARRQRAAFAAAIESRHHDLRARAQASAGVVIPPG